MLNSTLSVSNSPVSFRVTAQHEVLIDEGYLKGVFDC